MPDTSKRYVEKKTFHGDKDPPGDDTPPNTHGDKDSPGDDTPPNTHGDKDPPGNDTLPNIHSMGVLVGIVV
jgi:hypothetical protein